MAGLMGLLAYGAQDIYLTGPAYEEYKVNGKIIITDNIDDLIKHGYDKSKYNYENDDLWIKYYNQLKEIEKEIEKNTTDNIFIFKEIKNNTECPVTYDTIENKYYHCTRCKNNFHYIVIKDWIKVYRNCPMCRYTFNYEEVRYVYCNNIEELYTKKQIDFLKKRKKVLEKLIFDIEEYYYEKDNIYRKEIIDKALFKARNKKHNKKHNKKRKIKK
jgi:hypothetical protein